MTPLEVTIAGTVVVLLMIGGFAYLTRTGEGTSKTSAGTPPSPHGTDHRE